MENYFLVMNYLLNTIFVELSGMGKAYGDFLSPFSEVGHDGLEPRGVDESSHFTTFYADADEIHCRHFVKKDYTGK